jgi:hypothetical protein
MNLIWGGYVHSQNITMYSDQVEKKNQPEKLPAEEYNPWIGFQQTSYLPAEDVSLEKQIKKDRLKHRINQNATSEEPDPSNWHIS